jgi:ribosomal protein S18 acetylase RimI-like enzyme
MVTPSSPSLAAFLDGIVHLHATCVLTDYTLATFLPPLSHAQMLSWWEARVAEVQRGERHILVWIARVAERNTNVSVRAPWVGEGRDWPVLPAQQPSPPSASSTAPPSSQNSDLLELAGVVSLYTPWSQTGPFRGVVHKFFVHPHHRRLGIGRHLMTRLEAIALRHGRWNLMLDTEAGSEAEKVYPRLGWERMGVVRGYGFSPRDGREVDEVWFWKDLRRESRLEEREKEEKD